VSVALDAFALIALLADEPAADQVEALLRRGEAAITAINLAEALDVLQRVQGIAPERLRTLTVPLLQGSVELLPVDETLARGAGELRARHYHRSRSPLSLADCVLLAAAQAVGAIATADEPLIRAARAECIRVAELRR
jgi:predicted nucleic acid-binding protein